MTEEKLDIIRTKIGQQIALQRQKIGISQEELALKTGMGVSTIARFESGKFWINLKQYIIIKTALNLTESIT